jgi:hypothetical protein
MADMLSQEVWNALKQFTRALPTRVIPSPLIGLHRPEFSSYQLSLESLDNEGKISNI